MRTTIKGYNIGVIGIIEKKMETTTLGSYDGKVSAVKRLGCKVSQAVRPRGHLGHRELLCQPWVPRL